MRICLFCIISVFLFSSCATIMTGDKAKITIDGNISTPVTIKADGRTYEDVSLPQQIEVPRNGLWKRVMVAVDSTNSVTLVPGKKTNNWVWGNLLGPGLLGLIVDDLITHNINKPRYDTFFIQAHDTLGRCSLEVKYYPEPKKHVYRFYRHEIGAQVGFASNTGSHRMERMGNYLEQHLNYEADFMCNYFGPYSLGLHYYYFLNRQWAIGLKYAFAHGYSPYVLGNIEGGMGVCGVRMRSHLMTAAVKWHWYKYDLLEFYSKAALGVQHRHVYCSFNDEAPYAYIPDEREWLPSYQISPMCMELGRKRLRFFIELGYGNEGIFSMGISTKI